MVDIILTGSMVVLALAMIGAYCSLRKMKKAFDIACDAIASNYACFDYLKEEAEQNHDAIQYLIDRHEKHMVFTKYNLANTRLHFCMHQQAAVKAENYEDAQHFVKAISNIEELLENEQ